jgi:uncharacterized protein (TIGR00251 family)
MDEVEISERSGMLLLPVRVQPRAAKNQISGSYNGALKVRLAAPPLKDRANRELLRFLARSLELPAKNLSLIQGQHSRNKTVTIRGLSREELVERLARVSHTRS